VIGIVRMPLRGGGGGPQFSSGGNSPPTAPPPSTSIQLDHQYFLKLGPFTVKKENIKDAISNNRKKYTREVHEAGRHPKQ
jgi:hypothetical protein